MRKTFLHIRKYIPIVLAVLTLVDILVLKVIAGNKIEVSKRIARVRGFTIVNEIRLTLDNILESTESLKYLYLSEGETCFDIFDTYSSYMIQDKPEIASVYIAPDGVIAVAYPESVKEATIGFQMLKDPFQGPKAQKAVDTREITIAGPHALVEGGVGFILRNPVFIDDTFIGFTIIIIDRNSFSEKIMNSISTSEDNYKFGIWKEEHDDTAIVDSQGYIFRNTEDSISRQVNIAFDVPNDVWHLSIEPIDGWLSFYDLLNAIVTLILFTIVILVALFFLVYASDRKKQLERQRYIDNARKKYTKQLSIALEQAKNASEAKTNFLSNMSHDIRTPMNAIIGFTDLMERDIDDPEKLRDYIKKVQKSGKFLLTIINNILDITKIDSGKLEVDEVLVDLTDDKCNIISLVESDIQQKNLKFSCNMDIQHKYVYADMEKINQINMNLASNAIKYTPNGGSIHLFFKELPSDRPGYARYMNCWSDTGIGMSKEFLETIFEPFSRERNSTESKVIGTGLGMAIVKKLTDLMGGTIEVESEIGKGTTFRLYFEHRIADNVEDQIKKNLQTETVLPDFTGKHILLAEDNELNAEIAVAILSDLGFVVDVAEDGIICIDKFRKSEYGYYDFILMDIQMPNLNGYQTTEKIRKAGFDIPIIAMTANAFEEDRKNALNAGMNGHIAKPIDVQELIRIISEVSCSN